MTISAKIVCDSVSQAGARLTTLELTYPRFIHSQVLMHRCLAGDSELWFDLPSGTTNSRFRLNTMTVSEFYDKWVNGSKRVPSSYVAYPLHKLEDNVIYRAKEIADIIGMQSVSTIHKHCREGRIAYKNINRTRSDPFLIKGKDFKLYYSKIPIASFSLRSRLKNMKLRMLNEHTNEIEHTAITDIWESGVQRTYTIYAGGYKLTTTDNHLFYTSEGWKELKDIRIGDEIYSCGFGVHEKKDPYKHKYIDGKWVSIFNRKQLADLTIKQENICSNCAREAKLEIHHIHPVHLYPEYAFDVNNIVAICSDCHKNIYHKKQGWQSSNRLLGKLVVVEEIEYVGEQMTYDLSVDSDFHNFIASGLVVHNCISRNSASSRAIPVSKMIDNILANPVIPIHFGKNQSGMQAQTEEVEREEAVTLWLESMYQAIKIAKEFEKLGLHKQIANRVLEPYSHITTLVTATEWDNFFTLRLADDAQPEIQELAKVMKEAITESTPTVTKVHLPYITKQEKDNNSFSDLARISAARCCRVSYLNHNNEYSIQKDLTLAGNLIENRHFSPLEAVAIALDNKEQKDANFTGWKQYRTIIIENQNKNQG